MDFLNLTNYRQHPEDDRYLVFTVKNKEQSVFFEDQLKQHQIYYEKFEDEDKHISFFGIKNKDARIAKNLNNLAIGKYRRPFIPHRGLGIAVILLTFGFILLALIGYILHN